jgi:hypothetical protein
MKVGDVFSWQANPAPVLDSPDHLPIFEDQLLDGLQNWMDRLFEGSTYRFPPFYSHTFSYKTTNLHPL